MEKRSTAIGVLHLTLNIAQAQSLKDKRRIVKSFKDRTRNRFNVSVAEVDGLDRRQLSVLAISMVANDRQYAEGVLRKIADAAAMHRDMILLDQTLEWL